MPGRIRDIVIVGGGSAGWLTAGVLASEHRTRQTGDVRVTLIESPDVKSIGVGEGTWPSMRDTLRRMGISESEFITNCDASFKQASRFTGWVTGAADDHYYHPFSAPQGYGEVNLVPAWLELGEDFHFADLVSFQPQLCERGKAPKQKTTPEFAAVANYAYHLDAGKFGQFMQKFCVENLGVRHVLAHVQAIRSHDNGDIAGLETPEQGLLEGDLFIDCTGFSALLLDQHYAVPHVNISESLFCDTAIAAQVPYAAPECPIASHTISTAQDAGWIWDIGLPGRRGVGHVYSSAHTTGDQAGEALLAYIRRTGGGAAEPVLRKISLNPGYRQTFWHRNCVAVGISAGFIEPLEASALALIELSARMISDELPPSRDLMEIVARRFNERFRYRWSRIIDFLKLHYVLSRRTDTDFWIDNRRPESISGRLQELLALWRFRPPSSRDFPEIEEVFPAASYQYVLYGMGFRPERPAHLRRLDDPQAATRCFQTVAQQTRKYLAGLPSNRDLIDHVRARGLPRV
jgi:flavin-dependent dehydrogenase